MGAILTSAAEFLTALPALKRIDSRPVTTRSVFMVMPEQFSVNTESAVDNPYMAIDRPVDPARALAQARALASQVESLGIDVQRFPGRVDQPDGVFPNNVFATVPGGFIIGAMKHPGRRREASRKDIRKFFVEAQDRELVDLSRQELVAELTGPLIIDHGRAIGYCGMTGRVDEPGLAAMQTAFGLQCVFRFALNPGEYHTNVVMSVLAGRACVICPDAFPDPAVPQAIGAAYPRRTLLLNEAEKLAFAGNCIALTDSDLFMSATGARALEPQKRARLEEWGFTLHTAELDEIEKAGGSLRCMIAEVF